MLKAMLTAKVLPRSARRFSDALVHADDRTPKRDPVNRVAPILTQVAPRRPPPAQPASAGGVPPSHEKGLPKVYL